MRDLQNVVTDADSLLKEVANSTVDEFNSARHKIEGRMGDARASLHDARVAVSGKANHVAEVTHDYVMANPWKSLGLMASAGVLVGLLLRRR